MPYSRPRPLERGDEREHFECGEPALDHWLAEHALEAQRADTSRVFVASDGSRVVGYYALAAAEVRPAEATARARKGQPQRRPIPAVLLARLAVDRGHQGRGLGRSLLQDAMLRADEAAEELGIRVMLVHAKHEQARRWLEGSPGSPPHAPDGGGHTSHRGVLGLALATSKGGALRPGDARSGARRPHTRDSRANPGRFGFEESPADPLHLMLMMKDLRAFLATVSS